MTFIYCLDIVGGAVDIVPVNNHPRRFTEEREWISTCMTKF
jgi:hypothetical protein